jgi:replication factor A3
MAEPTSTPRVTAQYLDGHAGKNVMIVGKVIQLRGDSAIIESQGNVSLVLNRVGSFLFEQATTTLLNPIAI